MTLKILTWDQARIRILATLATIDQSISSRLDHLENNWQAIRHSEEYLAGRQHGFGEPETMESKQAPRTWQSTEANLADGKVPDYLQ
jgi:hypothetical protein